METKRPIINRRKLYTYTLMCDPRWKGPYLAIALLFGVQTGPSGEGRAFLVHKNAHAMGIAYRGVHQIVRALIEQGYLIRTDAVEPLESSAYQLSGVRPAIEMDGAMPGERIAAWDDPGPATAWLRAETSVWTRFQIEREQVWREQATADPEYWQPERTGDAA